MRAGLRGVRAAAEVEPVLGPRQPELVEEDLGELGVVVLARVDEHLLGRLRAGGPETAAALTNCGRFPMTVRTRHERVHAGLSTMP